MIRPAIAHVFIAHKPWLVPKRFIVSIFNLIKAISSPDFRTRSPIRKSDAPANPKKQVERRSTGQMSYPKK